MLYIVLLLSGCYLLHYINANKKNEMADGGDVLLNNDQTASSSNAPETDVII